MRASADSACSRMCIQAMPYVTMWVKDKWHLTLLNSQKDFDSSMVLYAIQT